MSADLRRALEMQSGLMAIAAQIRAWLQLYGKLRFDEPQHLVSLPAERWPTQESLEGWISLLQECHDAIGDAARQYEADMTGPARMTVTASVLPDSEMQAIAICIEALKRLPVSAAARGRVLSYLQARSEDEFKLGKEIS